jgi:hypothetical protein
MSKTNKLVMQVTLDAQEFPGLFSDLSGMRDGRRRASKLLRMAYFGWLVEQGRLAATASGVGSAPAQDRPASPSRVGCPISEFVEFGDRDDP